jgi:hypothetical protein
MRVDNGVVRVGRDIVPKGQSGYLFTIYDGLTVRLDGETGCPVPEEGTNDVVISFEAVSRPAIFRGRRIGDEIVIVEKSRSIGDAGRRVGARQADSPWPAVVEDEEGVAVVIWQDAVALRDGGAWRVAREDDPTRRRTTLRIRG